jgi:hypothetical protein
MGRIHLLLRLRSQIHLERKVEQQNQQRVKPMPKAGKS